MESLHLQTVEYRLFLRVPSAHFADVGMLEVSIMMHSTAITDKDTKMTNTIPKNSGSKQVLDTLKGTDISIFPVIMLTSTISLSSGATARNHRWGLILFGEHRLMVAFVRGKSKRKRLRSSTDWTLPKKSIS